MKLYDHECGWLEERRALALLKSSPQAARYFELLQKNSNAVGEWGTEFTPSQVNLWQKIQGRITQEERLNAILPQQQGLMAFLSSWQNVWISRFGWSLSGAFVTALVGWMVIRTPNNVNNYDLRSSSVDSIPLVINASDAGQSQRSFNSRLELDWLRSAGKLSMIQDPAQRTTILWVKRNRPVQPTRIPLIIQER